MADFEGHLFLELFLQRGRRQPKFKNRSLKLLFIVFIFDKEPAINQATHLTIYLSNWETAIEFGRIMNLSREKSTKRRQPRNAVYVYPFLCLLPLIPILKLLDPLPNLVTLSSFSSIQIIGNVDIYGISLVLTILRTCVAFINSEYKINTELFQIK